MIENKPTAFCDSRGERRVFRSHLEAKWGKYFDLMGAQWSYEPYRFVLNDKGLTYCPDFKVEGIGVIEVKPYFDALSDSIERIEQFCAKSGERVYAFCGSTPFDSVIAILADSPLRGVLTDAVQRIIILAGESQREFAAQHFETLSGTVKQRLGAASSFRDFDPVSVGEIMRITGAVERSSVGEKRGLTILRRIMKHAGTKAAA